MAFIYKITNLLNGKIYIGQTRMTVKQRMYKHYSRANQDDITGIDAAIKKYGKENFSVEILEECEEEKLDERERYYINLFSSYGNGYNLTLGGQDGIGSLKTFSIEEVEAALQKGGDIKQASKILNCCEKTLSFFMKRNSIENPYQNKGKVENILGKGRQFKEGDQAKRVYCKELDKNFPSLKECAQFLIDNGYSKASSMEAARKGLSRHLTGKRNSYLHMHFTYL